MKSRVKIIIILLLVILIPLGVQKLIQYKQLPESITIATGSVGGRYFGNTIPSGPGAGGFHIDKH